MTDDELFDQYIASHGKEAPAAAPKSDDQLFDEYIASHHVDSTPEKTQEHARVAESSVPPEYRTTTATNPAEVKQEEREGIREDFKRGAFEDNAKSAAYKVLRGGTLGFSDRLVGAGASLAEMMGAGGGGNPYAEQRQSFMADEKKAAEGANPIVNLAAEGVGSIVPALATGGMNRFAQAGTLGGLAGVGNTQSDKPMDMLKGGGLGAAMGLAAEGTLGTLTRNMVRNAPENSTRGFMKDIMESDAGKALPKSAKQIYKFFDDVAALKSDPEIAAAVRLKEGAGVPILQQKLDQRTFTNDVLYDKLQKHADHPWVNGRLSVDEMDQALMKAETKVKDPRVAVAIEGIRDDLKGYWRDRVWGGNPTPTAQEWREWLTKQQDTAFSKLGGLNETENFSRAVKAVGEASHTYNRYLDSLGRPDIVEHIRANNEYITGLLLAKAGLEQRGWKEAMGSMGLTKLGQEQLAHTENGAALAALAYGHPEVAAAVKLRRPATEVAAAGMRKLNDRVLSPLEEAARAGVPAALLGRAGIEAVPQAAARVGEGRLAPGGPYIPPRPTLQQVMSAPAVAPAVDTSGYGTSTAVR